MGCLELLNVHVILDRGWNRIGCYRTHLEADSDLCVDKLLLARVEVEEGAARVLQAGPRLMIIRHQLFHGGLRHRLVEQRLQMQTILLVLNLVDFALKLNLGPIHKLLLAVLGEAHALYAVFVALNEGVVRAQLLQYRVNFATLVVQLRLVIESLVLDKVLYVHLLGHFFELSDHFLNFLLPLVLLIKVYFFVDVDWVELFQVPIHVIVSESGRVCLLELYL